VYPGAASKAPPACLSHRRTRHDGPYLVVIYHNLPGRRDGENVTFSPSGVFVRFRASPLAESAPYSRRRVPRRFAGNPGAPARAPFSLAFALCLA